MANNMANEKMIYPAIFHKDENGGYWVEFPDIPGCLTEASTQAEALNMAGDALFTWFAGDDQEVPMPSNVTDIKVESDGDFVTLVKAEPYENDEAIQFRAAIEVEEGLKARKLNKTQAALILGVDSSYFSHITSGKKTPSPEMAQRIGLLCGFDWHVFFPAEALV